MIDLEVLATMFPDALAEDPELLTAASEALGQAESSQRRSQALKSESAGTPA